ncbi:MAG: cupin domain-containing protein [Clostridiales bacterium]|nr:cupin domain-containing protein [Clostridiales bacterium]
MAINIAKFDPASAYKAHEGTILAQPVLPGGVKAPFRHQYGYLMKGGAMAGHAHPTDEIYIVLSGSGIVILGGRNRRVKAGDVVAIPGGEWHTMLCAESDEEPFLWGALWWEPVAGGTPAAGGIEVKAFREGAAYRAHQDTILADKVVPASLAAPFSHQYGYLGDGGEMELHSHPAMEVYIVFYGSGTVIVGGEEAPIGPGDVIEIPPGEPHTVRGKAGVPLLWAALWWPDAERAG